jgi:hypothetical protein
MTNRRREYDIEDPPDATAPASVTWIAYEIAINAVIAKRRDTQTGEWKFGWRRAPALMHREVSRPE